MVRKAKRGLGHVDVDEIIPPTEYSDSDVDYEEVDHEVNEDGGEEVEEEVEEGDDDATAHELSPEY